MTAIDFPGLCIPPGEFLTLLRAGTMGASTRPVVIEPVQCFAKREPMKKTLLALLAVLPATSSCTPWTWFAPPTGYPVIERPRSTRISAPPPGMLSMPASFSSCSTSRTLFLSRWLRCTISGGLMACSQRSG